MEADIGWWWATTLKWVQDTKIKGVTQRTFQEKSSNNNNKNSI